MPRPKFTFADRAIRVAREGWPVFPCLPDKRPAISDWQRRATREEDVIRELFPESLRQGLIGVLTGEPSGIDVLDIDPRSGGEIWLDRHFPSYPTRCHVTRSYGLHLLFRHAEGVRNSASRVAQGVDIRGTGGFIIWWPAHGFMSVRKQIVDWPAWLLDLVRPPPTPPPARNLRVGTNDIVSNRYFEQALRRAIEAVATAPAGARNNRLNAETFSLARLIPEGLSPSAIADCMSVAGLQAGLKPGEVERTITSALRARGVA